MTFSGTEYLPVVAILYLTKVFVGDFFGDFESKEAKRVNGETASVFRRFPISDLLGEACC